MILTPINNYSSGFKKNKHFYQKDENEKSLTGKSHRVFLWHILKAQLPAMKAVNLASINLHTLHSGVTKELTQPSLDHYNCLKITFETVIQMHGQSHCCVNILKSRNKQIQVIIGLSTQH